MEPYDQQQFLNNWEPKRQKGLPRFLLRSAVVYGVMMLLLSIVMDLFEYSLKEALTRQLLSLHIVFFAIGGLLLGWFLWRINERLYRKFTG